MDIDERIGLLVQLGAYITGESEDWQAAKQRATAANAWFIPQFINNAATNISSAFLQHGVLKKLAQHYNLDEEVTAPQTVGIVLAGNIPLVGFHDVMCTFLTGHKARLKPSAKDAVLITHLLQKLTGWNPAVAQFIEISELLKGCDAYIATGGNNTARYFEYYFRAYPSIIRNSRTSVAVLSGNETEEALSALSDDINLYFGLGCRNVTQLYVPRGYDFRKLLDALDKYAWFINHNKYKNNYDYNLAIHLLNHDYYMTNSSVLLVENAAHFSPISQVHFQYYDDAETVLEELKTDDSVQCIVGHGLPFGAAQRPGVTDFADGVDTMAFLKSLKS